MEQVMWAKFRVEESCLREDPWRGQVRSKNLNFRRDFRGRLDGCAGYQWCSFFVDQVKTTGFFCF